MTWKTWLALLTGVVVGFALASSVQELLDAKKRSWTKRTAADCRSISDAIEKYRTENGEYPPLDGDVQHLAGYLTPRYLRQLPTRDMSNQPFLVVKNGSKVTVISIGHYGVAVEAGAFIRGGAWLK